MSFDRFMMQIRSPAEIAAQALGAAVSDVVSVEPIKHGLTNDSWRVRTHSDVIVVRRTTADDAVLRIDRESEARILAAVAAANIGAPIVRCDSARRILVTRYLGPAWTSKEAHEPRNIERLGRLLQRLHALTPPAGVRTVDLAATANGYVDTLAAHDAAAELRSNAMRERASRAAASLPMRTELRLCHNDVHHLNIIDGGELHLIDWEYAGLGEPLFDLASVCVYHRYSAPQRDALRAAYASDAAACDSNFEAALWLFEYVRDLWTAVRALDKDP